MKQLDTKKLELLLEQKKWQEAKKLIDDHLKSDLTSEEKGAVLTQFASVYMELQNQINSAYRDSLAGAVDFLKNVNEKEKEAKREVGAGDIKKQIKKLYDKDK